MLQHCYGSGSIVVSGFTGLLRLDADCAEQDLEASALSRQAWWRIEAAFHGSPLGGE